MIRIDRRHFAVRATALFFAASAGIASAQGTGKPIVIGQTATLTGQLSLANVEYNRGVQAHVDEINAKGGIAGRPLRYVSMEDGADPERAKANFKKLVETDEAIALLGVGGTVVTGALLPLLAEARIPLLAPVTGADQLRAAHNPYAFHLRASYGTELSRLAEQLATVGQKKVAVTHSENTFGKAAATGFAQIAKARGLDVTLVPIGDTADEIPKALKTLMAAEPNAIVSLFASPSLNGIEIVRAYRKERSTTPWYTISLLGSTTTIEALGKDAAGMTISQVMPYPFVTTTPIVRDYQAAIKKSKNQTVSHNSLEGYIAARILTQSVRQAGRDVTRDKVVAALEAGKIDLGGFDVTYTKTNHNGSRFTDLVLVGSRGNLIR